MLALDLNGLEIPCYVLNDGTRVISTTGMQKALGIMDNEPNSIFQPVHSAMPKMAQRSALAEKQKILKEFSVILLVLEIIP